MKIMQDSCSLIFHAVPSSFLQFHTEPYSSILFHSVLSLLNQSSIVKINNKYGSSLIFSTKILQHLSNILDKDIQHLSNILDKDLQHLSNIRVKDTSLRRQGHSLTACNAAPPATTNRPLNPKWPTGSGKRLNLLGYLTLRSTFTK